jgi:3-hydroxypropanoate dehydrogenase
MTQTATPVAAAPKATLNPEALDQLFRTARTAQAFEQVYVSDQQLHDLYNLLKFAPTAFNAQPARFVFVRSAQAKERLKPALSAGNVDKSLAASVTVIVAQDTRFFEHLPKQFPAYDAKPLFVGNAALAEATAFRNSSLQGAYLILAARSLGLDAGPQSGFDAELVNKSFFPSGRYKANFLINLGVAKKGAHYVRGPRLAFDDVAEVL